MDNYKLTSADIAGLVIYLGALVTRAVMQQMAGPGEMPDLGWITTFAGIAAMWLSLGARTRDVHDIAKNAADSAAAAEENTNGKLDDKIEEAISKALARRDADPVS